MKIYRPSPPPKAVLDRFRAAVKAKDTAEKRFEALLAKDPRRLKSRTVSAENALHAAKGAVRAQQGRVDDASPLYWSRVGQPVRIISSANGQPFPLVIEFQDGYRGIAEPESIVEVEVG